MLIKIDKKKDKIQTDMCLQYVQNIIKIRFLYEA